MTELTGVDRDGNKLEIGDVVDVLAYWNISDVMQQATVIGFDPNPSYCLDCVGVFLDTQTGSIHPLGVRKRMAA